MDNAAPAEAVPGITGPKIGPEPILTSLKRTAVTLLPELPRHAGRGGRR